MGVEKTVFDYRDIVPQPTWAEQNLPTFLGLARRMGYFLPDQTPKEYPAEMTVQMPSMPWSALQETHPLLDFFGKVYDVANRMVFKPGEEKQLHLRLDEVSFDRVISVPYHGDDSSFVGDAMFHLMALNDYAQQWFEQRGYRVTSFGAGSSHELELGLKRA